MVLGTVTAELQLGRGMERDCLVSDWGCRLVEGTGLVTQVLELERWKG